MFVIAILGLFAGVMVYAMGSMRWLGNVTDGDRYFSLPINEREALKKRIWSRGLIIRPVGKLIAPIFAKLGPPTFSYKGFTGPQIVCSFRTFKYAANYEPDEHDIFVATQVKCGTTWMQQIVFEILCKGRGDLSDQGYRSMYALSPWIESHASVAMQDAPLIGEAQKRIIKTHLPTQLCPYDPKARYICIARHPVSCYASFCEFVEMLAGPFVNSRSIRLEDFCSDSFVWGSWPNHVEGYWNWSRERDNVLLLHYEDMKVDLKAEVEKVAAFLEQNLSREEIQDVVRKSTFEYMKQNELLFEMSAPTFFSKNGRFMKSGSLKRNQDASEEAQTRIAEFCRAELEDANYPSSEVSLFFDEHCP